MEIRLFRVPHGKRKYHNSYITLHVEYNTARGVAPGVGCEHWIVRRPGAAHHGWAAPGEILEFKAPKRDSVTRFFHFKPVDACLSWFYMWMHATVPTDQTVPGPVCVTGA